MRAFVRAGFFSVVFSLSAFAFTPPHIEGVDLVSGEPFRWVRGKTNVVVFLSATCPCSQGHEPALAALARKHPEAAFLGIISNSGPQDDATVAHFKAVRLPFPLVRESGHAWADAFGALNTPHVFVLDEKGDWIFRGGVDDSRSAERVTRGYLAEALDALSNGRSVAVREARPLGCAIRR